LRVLLRAGFRAVPVDPFAVDRLAAGLRAADVRLAPAVEARARVELAAFDPLLRLAVERFAVERLADVLRAPPLRDDADDERPDDDRPLLLALGASSAAHLPDITRCAASATASAISEPSLVALAIMLVAAVDAVSAASSPASRIARRALGLALIAAAAAASPAASISLLIAALASLSTVSLPEEEPEDLVRADFAIASLPPLRERHFKPVTVPERSRKSAAHQKCKGHRRGSRRCPSTWSAAGSDGRSLSF
jgi:hypothetical protein